MYIQEYTVIQPAAAQPMTSVSNTVDINQLVEQMHASKFNMPVAKEFTNQSLSTFSVSRLDARNDQGQDNVMRLPLLNRYVFGKTFCFLVKDFYFCVL